MATKTQYANVLRAMKTAPNSVSASYISAATGVPLELVDRMVSALVETNYIKENAENRGTYFTRRPMREDIAGFITAVSQEGDGTDYYLTGISFTPADTTAQAPRVASDPVTSPTLQIPPVTIKDVLAAIKNSSNALLIDNPIWAPYVVTLVHDGLIKEHRDKPGYYFTVRGKRNLIEDYLEGHMDYSGFFYQTTPEPTPAPSERPTTAAMLLKLIKESTNSYQTSLTELADSLISLGLIRRHRDFADKYFTVRAQRENIAAYLDGYMSWDELLRGADPMFTNVDGSDGCTGCPECTDAERRYEDLLSAEDESFVPESDFLNMVQALHDMSSYILRNNGRA